MFEETGIGTFTRIQNEDVMHSRSFANHHLARMQWHDVEVFLQESWLEVGVDGIPLAQSFYLDSRLQKGYLVFECHQEYWIDDLEIMNL